MFTLEDHLEFIKHISNAMGVTLAESEIEYLLDFLHHFLILIAKQLLILFGIFILFLFPLFLKLLLFDALHHFHFG